MAKAVKERYMEHFGFGTLVLPCDSFYDLQARDVLGSAVDFGEYRGKARKGRVDFCERGGRSRNRSQR